MTCEKVRAIYGASVCSGLRRDNIATSGEKEIAIISGSGQNGGYEEVRCVGDRCGFRRFGRCQEGLYLGSEGCRGGELPTGRNLCRFCVHDDLTTRSCMRRACRASAMLAGRVLCVYVCAGEWYTWSRAMCECVAHLAPLVFLVLAGQCRMCA